MPAGVLRASLILEDASGNRTGAIVKETTLTIVPPPDTAPPAISDIAVAADSSPMRIGGVVTLSFSANEALDIANTQAIFTISGEQHAQPVTLVPNTQYRYQTTLTVTDAVPDGTLEEVTVAAYDVAGNSERFTQSADLTIEKVAPPLPAVASIGYYRDRTLTKPFIDTVMEGDTVYTKVVFAKELPAGITDSTSAQPSIFSAVGSKEFQYRMQPQDTPEENFRSGDARPSQDSTAIICKYFVQREEVGETFLTYIGDGAVSGTPLQVLFFVYTDEIAIAAETITDWSPTDFTGQVYVPKHERSPVRIAGHAQPLPNVIVTIMAGPRAGERTSTDSNGRYLFPDVAADTLHLRAERARFEPKEVLVHRQHPTALANGAMPNFHEGLQKHPGNIVIGYRWPDEVRFILQETLVVHDLLYSEGGIPPSDRVVGGFYFRGMAVIYSNLYTHSEARSALLGTFAHEIAHAHQDALIAVDGSGDDFGDWTRSPEGVAFEEARKKDWEEVGKADYDLIPGYATLWENAAQTCALYWSAETRWSGLGRYEKLEISAPHRFKWAAEWLTKR